jgi:glycosyltransferase involved in cell wall biosynthesis
VRLVIALEQHFLRAPDGRVWTETNLDRPYWDRYLGVFDCVRIVARTRSVAAVDERWARVDGGGVSVAPVPDFVGPLQYARTAGSVRAAVRAELRPGDAVILRVPGTIGTVAAAQLARTGLRFGVEVVGDPWDVFAPGAVSHPLRPLFRRWFARNLRRQCRAAAAALYVTRAALQRRYPPAPGAHAVGVSDVDLPDAAFVETPGARREPAGRFRLLSVGSMAQRYKGHDLVITALHSCRGAGLEMELVIVGDGRERAELERLAARLGVAAHVAFLGQLPSGEAVRQELDRAHLFVMASRVEGLPRALVEAMARALPCVGTEVGGIPELLSPEALVPAEDAAALAARIRRLHGDEPLRRSWGRRSWETARTYREAALQPQREAFYRAVVAAALSERPPSIQTPAEDDR